MTVGEKIKEQRKIHKMTQSDLAKKLNIAPTAVSAWERNANRPLMDKLTIMSEMFDVPITYWFDVEDVSISDDMALLPVYGNISCGKGLVVFDTPESYEPVPKEWLNGGEYFFLRAKGDSMSGARIYDGDLLMIRRQTEVENGEIAAVVIDGQAVLKRVYFNENNIILQSENSAYPPISYNPKENSDIMIIGKLKKVILNF